MYCTIDATKLATDRHGASRCLIARPLCDSRASFTLYHCEKCCICCNKLSARVSVCLSVTLT